MARDVEWLWHQRVPLGKLTLISGDPNLGKTWTVLYMIARITTGRPFPDSANPFENRRNALWVSGEDEDEDTIRPRIDLLGGDPTRVHSLAFVFHDGKERTLSLGEHLNHIDNWLIRNPLVSVVAIDPFAAFLGKIDSHRNSDVRGLLTPLMKLASKHKVAIIGINHLSKGDGSSAMYRGMGSIAFVAAARSSWMVSRDPKGPADRRLFTNVKNNLASEDVGGLAFRVGPDHNGIRWEDGIVRVTADETLQHPDKSRAPQRAEAKEWLLDLLKDGPVSAADVWTKSKADGMCEKTVKLAKKELGVRTKKSGGAGEPWLWSLSKSKK
ncbi:MAG: AAA family ATPase [Planctomycetia bacterium]|nr:AAA family ATPase [Planctomycetia bacterium]